MMYWASRISTRNEALPQIDSASQVLGINGRSEGKGLVEASKENFELQVVAQPHGSCLLSFTAVVTTNKC